MKGLEKSLYQINLENKPKNLLKDSFRKKNLDVWAGWTILFSSSLFGVAHSPDKLLHAIYGYTLGKSGSLTYKNFSKKYHMIKDWWKELTTSLSFYTIGGIAKEIFDTLQGEYFSIGDMTAGYIGLGIFAGIEFYRRKKLKTELDKNKKMME